MRAADRAGAEIFLVPRENGTAARSVGVDVRLAPVSSVEEAIRFLRSTRS